MNVSKLENKDMNFRVTRANALRFKRLGCGISGTNKLFLAVLNVLDKYPQIKEEILEEQLK